MPTILSQDISWQTHHLAMQNHAQPTQHMAPSFAEIDVRIMLTAGNTANTPRTTNQSCQNPRVDLCMACRHGIEVCRVSVKMAGLGMVS